MIENCFNREIRAIFYIVSSSSRWFNKERIREFSWTFLEINPAMFSSSSIWIIFYEVWFIVINNSLFDFFSSKLSSSLIFLLFIKCGVWILNLFNFEILNCFDIIFLFFNHKMCILINIWILIFITIWHVKREWAVHQALIFRCNLLWSCSNNNICIISNTNKK